jgi:xanthine/uracil/vitamin C permease (AzgA family)
LPLPLVFLLLFVLLQHAVPAFITIVTMPMCYSIAYGFIAGICSYLVLYIGNFMLDIIGVAMGKDSLQNVLFNNCPGFLQERLKIPAPVMSPSAVLQVGTDVQFTMM